MPSLSPNLFKAYDIRGIVGKTLTPEVAEVLGRAIGTEALVRKQARLCVGRDGRLSSEALADALTQGVLSTGVNVVDVGMVPTPLLYFATHELGCHSGIMVTGSHNPPEYNGFKIMLGGDTLAGEAIQALRQRIDAKEFADGRGLLSQASVAEAYYSRIVADIQLDRPVSVVTDCGNGVAGAFAPVLYRRMGCKVRSLFSEVDGHFPNHHPDPSRPENLNELIHAVASTDAELGLAFDGDGDRLGVVGRDGRILYPDRALMLFAAEVLEKNPGAKIVYDVKSTRLLAPWIKQHKGKPVLCRTGHSYMKAKQKEVSALLCGELSGHVLFADRWPAFDDGIYAGARLLEIVARVDNPTALFNALPDAISTPELQLPLKEGQPTEVMQTLGKQAEFAGATDIINLDGLRVEFDDGFGLVRASNTTPMLTLRFEADTPEALARIRKVFLGQIQAVLPDAVF